MVPPKPVPPTTAKALTKAQADCKAARAHRDALIVEALRAGAGLRAVGECIDLSHAAVAEIAKTVGWPDAKELKRREDEARARREWREQLDRDIEQLKRTRANRPPPAT